MVQQFRKKPVVINAIQFDGSNFKEIKTFGGDSITHEQKSGSSADGGGGRQLYEKLMIITPEGTLNISTNDFVIKGVNGEFYPCKPDIFHKTYELVNPSL